MLHLRKMVKLDFILQHVLYRKVQILLSFQLYGSKPEADYRPYAQSDADKKRDGDFSFLFAYSLDIYVSYIISHFQQNGEIN